MPLPAAEEELLSFLHSKRSGFGPHAERIFSYCRMCQKVAAGSQSVDPDRVAVHLSAMRRLAREKKTCNSNPAHKKDPEMDGIPCLPLLSG